MAIKFFIDKNRNFYITINYINSTQICIECSGTDTKIAEVLFNKLFTKLKFIIGGNIFVPTKYNEIFVIYMAQSSIKIQIFVDDTLIAEDNLNESDDSKVAVNRHALTVTDTRLVRVGYYDKKKIVFPPDSKPFITDLHTHFDGILPTYKLLDFAQKFADKIIIPATFFSEDTKIADSKLPVTAISLQALRKHYEALFQVYKQGLSIASGKQATFAEVDKIYSRRDFITGHSEWFAELLIACAQHYRSEHITYTELALSDILREKFFHSAVSVLPTIEATYHVKLRFLASIYNYIDEKTTQHHIEKIKILGHNPYIVGIDYAGHEHKDLSVKGIQYIEQIAKWASVYRKDFIIRVHAGETDLHQENVRLVLLIIKKYRLKCRIGHCLHGLDEATFKLLLELKDFVIIELNPDSNFALGNTQTLEQHHQIIQKLYAHKIPFVIGTDGAGIYNSSAEQLATTVRQAGADDKIIRFIQDIETQYIKYQNEVFLAKHKTWQPTKINWRNFDIAPPSDAKHAPTTFSDTKMVPADKWDTKSDKIPIYIASNTLLGTAKLDKRYLENIVNLFLQLIQICDHKKCFFIINNSHTEINIILYWLVKSHNRLQPLEKFDIVTVLPKQSENIFPELPCIGIGESYTDFPTRMNQYLLQQRGITLITGGDGIISDLIIDQLNTIQRLALVKGIPGVGNYYVNSIRHQFHYTDNHELISFLRFSLPNVTKVADSKSILADKNLIQPHQLIVNTLITYLSCDYRTLTGWSTRKGSWRLAETAMQASDSSIVSLINGNSIEFNPLVVRLLQLAADWHYRKIHNQQCETLLNRAIKLCSQLPASEEVDILFADIYLSYGILLTHQQGRCNESIDYLEKSYLLMVRLYGENDPGRTLRAYGAIGASYQCHDQFHDAIEIFYGLLKVKYPSYKNFWSERLWQRQDWKLEDWQEAGYRFNLSRCLFLTGHGAEAKTYMSKAAERYRAAGHSQQYALYNGLGFMYLASNELENAKVQFEYLYAVYEHDNQATILAPVMIVESYYGLAQVALLQNRVMAAKKLWDKCNWIILTKNIDISKQHHFEEFKSFETKLDQALEKIQPRYGVAALYVIGMFKKINDEFKLASDGKSQAVIAPLRPASSGESLLTFTAK